MDMLEKLGALVNIMGGIEGMIEESHAADELGLDDAEYQLPDINVLNEMYKEALDEAFEQMMLVDFGYELAIQALWEMYSGALNESRATNEPIITLLLTARIILNVIGNLAGRYNEQLQIAPVIRKDDGGTTA